MMKREIFCLWGYAKTLRGKGKEVLDVSKKIAALGLLLCLMLSGCSVTGLVVKAVYPDQKERPTSVDESILQSVQEFSAATSVELLSENDGNMLYSPLSLYLSLIHI